MKKYALFILLIAALIVSDHLLFSGRELVFPYFVFPYILLLILYIVLQLRDHSLGKGMLCLYAFIIIPVFAGFIMAVAWMIKINFFGELFGGYLIN